MARGIEVTADTRELENMFKAIKAFAPYLHGKGYPSNPIRNAARAMAKVAKDEADVSAPEGTRQGYDKHGKPVGPLHKSLVMKLLSARYRNDLKGMNSREYYYVSSAARKFGTYYMTPLELGWRKRDGRSYEGAHFLKGAVKKKARVAQQTFMTHLKASINRVENKILREYGQKARPKTR